MGGLPEELRAPSKTRIAHVATTELSLHTILKAKLRGLAQMGYEVVGVAARDAEAWPSPEGNIPIYYISISRRINPISDMFSLFRLIRLFHIIRPSIVHTHTSKAGFLGRISARLAGVPIVVHTCHGLPFYQGQSPVAYSFFRFLERFAGRLSDAILSQNRENHDFLFHEVAKGHSKVIYEGNGVNIEALRASAQGLDQLAERREYVCDDRPIITMVARFEPVKNHEMFLKVLACLKHDGVLYKALLVGSGPLLNPFFEQVRRLNLSDYVQFLGFRNDIPALLSISDVVCLTSRKEGIPRILMEAMAFAKPVVATDVLGTREVVIHGGTGFLVPIDDIEGFSACLKLLLKDRVLAGKFGSEGCRVARERFDESVVISRIDKVYKNLLKDFNNSVC